MNAGLCLKYFLFSFNRYIILNCVYTCCELYYGYQFADNYIYTHTHITYAALWWPTRWLASPSELTILPKREQRPLLVLHQFRCQLDRQPDDQHPQCGIEQEVHQVPAGGEVRWRAQWNQNVKTTLSSWLTYKEHGSSLVSVDRKTLAKWIKRAPMACFDVSKNLQNQSHN